MKNEEAALGVVRSVIDAMNRGDNDACMMGMSDNVVVIDDIAPFHWIGRQEVEQWLKRLAETRKRLQASLTLEAADVRVSGHRAYIVAPGLLTGNSAQGDFELPGLLTFILVAIDQQWLVDHLIWSCGRPV